MSTSKNAKYRQTIKARKKRANPKKPIHIVSRTIVPFTKKYLVVGGTVKSKNDGQYHYISPPRLCELYKIPMEECIFVWDRLNMPLGMDPRTKLIRLEPRSDGDYTVPTPQQEIGI